MGFGQHLNLRALDAQTARAQGHLRAAFLARDVERAVPLTLQGIKRLQQQR